MKKRIPLLLLLALVLIQLFPIDKKNPSIVADQDLSASVPQGQEAELLPLIKSACYDCHSHETTFPRYTRFQPVGWWTKGHVKGGRNKVNFSIWGNYTDKEKTAKAQACAEVLSEKRMPPKSYAWMHPDAKLDNEARAAMVEFFNNL